MVRYLALATALVLGAILIVTLLPHPGDGGAKGHTQYSSSSASPSAGAVSAGPATAGPVNGEAPWALSALPDCFRQDSRRAGIPAFARMGFPAAAKLVAAGTTLRFADCTLEVGTKTIAVSRDDSHLIVPALARLYAYPGHLVLDRSALGREEVRVYEIVARRAVY